MVRTSLLTSKLMGLLISSSLVFSLGCDMLKQQAPEEKKGRKPTAAAPEEGDVEEPTEPEDKPGRSSSSSSSGDPTGSGSSSSSSSSGATGGGSSSSSSSSSSGAAGGGSSSSSSSSSSSGAALPPGPNDASFQRDARAVMDRYCTECHHAGGRVLDLTQYPFTSGSASEQAALADRVIATMAAGTMPPAPRDKVPADAQAKFKTWRAALTP